MTSLFTINFRREVHQREHELAQRRMLSLALWVAYFGAVALLLGLYALNLRALQRKVVVAETRVSKMRANGTLPERLTVGTPELAQVERALMNPVRWRQRMTHLATVLPPNALLTSVTVNPDNLSGDVDQNRLVVVGRMRSTPGQDGLGGVMQLVSSLQSDSAFAAGYQSIKLVKSSVSSDPVSTTDFTIECR